MKNLKSFIGHLGVLLTSILAIVFLSQPHLTKALTSINGFDLNVDLTPLKVPEQYTAGFAFVVIATIALSFLILISIYNILVDFNIVKNSKIVFISKVIFGLISIISLVAIFACMASYTSEIGNAKVVSLGWGVIVNFVLCFVLSLFLLISDLGKKTKKSSNKRK